jgi:hypothetical protein
LSRLLDKEVLTPKDIQIILGISQKKLYEFLMDTPFRVSMVGTEQSYFKSVWKFFVDELLTKSVNNLPRSSDSNGEHKERTLME